MFGFFKLKINSLDDFIQIQSKYTDLWANSDIYTIMKIKNISLVFNIFFRLL